MTETMELFGDSGNKQVNTIEMVEDFAEKFVKVGRILAQVITGTEGHDKLYEAFEKDDPNLAKNFSHQFLDNSLTTSETDTYVFLKNYLNAAATNKALKYYEAVNHYNGWSKSPWGKTLLVQSAAGINVSQHLIIINFLHCETNNNPYKWETLNEDNQSIFRALMDYLAVDSFKFEQNPCRYNLEFLARTLPAECFK